MICPNCQKDAAITEQLYGALYTCANCQAVYFINFEGKPEYGDVSSEILSDIVADPKTQVGAEAPPSETPMAPVADFSIPFAASEESPPVDSDFSQSQQQAEPSAAQVESFGSLETIQETPVDAVPEAEPAAAPAAEPEPVYDYSNPDFNPFEAPAAEEKPKQSFTDVAKEISEFGNAEVQLAGLNYDLKVSGLDTQETVKLFREAIEDSKFGWDANEVMRTMKNGGIKFEKLSAVKAYILAKRLQFLDVEKEWKQNVLG